MKKKFKKTKKKNGIFANKMEYEIKTMQNKQNNIY